jgi:hypothetical protein
MPHALRAGHPSWLGMVVSGETLGSPWLPLAVRPCTNSSGGISNDVREAAKIFVDEALMEPFDEFTNELLSRRHDDTIFILALLYANIDKVGASIRRNIYNTNHGCMVQGVARDSLKYH